MEHSSFQPAINSIKIQTFKIIAHLSYTPHKLALITCNTNALLEELWTKGRLPALLAKLPQTYLVLE